MANLNVNGIIKATGGGDTLIPVDMVVEQGDNYIRYYNGLQIVFDRQKATGNPSTFTFPKAFIDTDYRVLFSNGNGKNDGTIVQNTNGITLGHYTTTSFQAEKYRGWDTSINYDFIAIGKWRYNI